MRRMYSIVVTAAIALSGLARIASAQVVFNEAEFRDKVYACWLGKNIGGTLGVPVEGQREMHEFTFYTPVPTHPLANDDLDLQLLWLKAMQERGPRIDARILAQYWQKYVPVDWNEYGVGKMNVRDGFWPPVSGQFRNKQWRDSNGAWIRSEIWACLAPGCPALAARYAYEDACVDHGAAEGTYAELFTASVESAAFVEHDRDKLIAIGLTFIPEDSALAKSIHAAMDAHRKGLDFKAARQAVVEASKSTGWFMAPQNVAFTILGWLYGDGDFGKSICAAVNCGDDTDCTGATLGSILGIIHGSKWIPDNWRKPIGEGIETVAIGGYRPPRTVGEFTDQTVAMAKVVLKVNNAPVEIRPDTPTDTSAASKLQLTDPQTARELWGRSPWRIPYTFGGLRATIDYVEDPKVEFDTPRAVKLLIENLEDSPRELSVAWHFPPGTKAEPAVTQVKVPAKTTEPVVCEAKVVITETPNRIVHGSVEIFKDKATYGLIPLAYLTNLSVSKNDVALASKGAKVTSDSELDRHPGCTAKVIDGEIYDEGDFETVRWHSALTSHPHWLTIELPAEREVIAAVIHFADPQDAPVEFEGRASLDGQNWQTIFKEAKYGDRKKYEKSFTPTKLKYFKLLISRSASTQFPDAAQISEIELIGTP